MTIKRISLVLFAILTCLTLLAQDRPADAPILKQYNTTTPFLGLKTEYFYKTNSCIYAHLNYNFNDQYRNWITNSNRMFSKIGIEANAGGRWYLGTSLEHRLSYTSKNNLAAFKLNGTHRGHIGSIQLLKELSFSYLHHFNNTFYATYKDYQLSLNLALYKSFKVFNRPLGFMVAYKTTLNSGLQFDLYKYRKIDFTTMGISIYYGITKNIFCGLFAQKETEYYYPPGTSAGTPPVNIYYKINAIKPIIGFNVNILIHPEKMENYIPGLPF